MRELYEHGIEVCEGVEGRRLVRVSIAPDNQAADVQRLLAALGELSVRAA